MPFFGDILLNRWFHLLATPFRSPLKRVQQEISSQFIVIYYFGKEFLRRWLVDNGYRISSSNAVKARSWNAIACPPLSHSLHLLQFSRALSQRFFSSEITRTTNKSFNARWHVVRRALFSRAVFNEEKSGRQIIELRKEHRFVASSECLYYEVNHSLQVVYIGRNYHIWHTISLRKGTKKP